MEIEEGQIHEQRRRYLHKGSHFTVSKRLGSRGDPRCSSRCPQVGPWAAEERVPELSLPHYHTDDYIEYHHRKFILSKQEANGFQNSKNDRDILLPGQSAKVFLYHWGIHLQPSGP